MLNFSTSRPQWASSSSQLPDPIIRLLCYPWCSYQPHRMQFTEARFQYLFARSSGATAYYPSDSCLLSVSLHVLLYHLPVLPVDLWFSKLPFINCRVSVSAFAHQKHISLCIYWVYCRYCENHSPLHTLWFWDVNMLKLVQAIKVEGRRKPAVFSSWKAVNHSMNPNVFDDPRPLFCWI